MKNEHDFKAALGRSEQILLEAIQKYKPTHIVSMVSGGNDSATSHHVLEELAQKLKLNIDFIIHCRTGSGIEDTTDFVKRYYGQKDTPLIIADAGTAYQDYVLRKGFFGKGIAAHGFAYRILKATPIRKAISKYIRKRRRNIRVLLINGARKDESENRKKHLKVFREDPAQKNNIWISIIYDWTLDNCKNYLENRQIEINPVSKNLCRSGECMCGTMQSDAERLEASIMYPKWGKWLDDLEKKAVAKFGFGWGENMKRVDKNQGDLFMPMCTDCHVRAVD